MELIEAIKRRRSVRMFKDMEVERNKLERLIDAAQWAPSACNKQLWEFIVVTDSRTKEMIVKEAGAAAFMKKAPVIVYVLYPRDVNHEHHANIQSAAAAINNMLLAAHEAGLGGVWVADCGERKNLHRILGIPQRFLIVSAVCLGYAEGVPPAPKRRELRELIHYERYKEKEPKRGYSYRDWTAKAVSDYREKGIRAASPFPHFFENLSGAEEFRKEIDFACRHIMPSDKVLDVLSFSGNHILEIMKEKNLLSVSIHDISNEIRYFLDERCQRLGIKGELNFNQGTLTKFSYPSNEFDVVTCFKKLNVLPNPEELMLEMRRVLKQEGRLILSVWNSESVSGVYQILKHRILLNQAPLTNEGPVMPLSISRLKADLKNMGMEIVCEEGVKLWRTFYMLCRKR